MLWGNKNGKKLYLFYVNKYATFFIFLFFFPVIPILVEKMELDKSQDSSYVYMPDLHRGLVSQYVMNNIISFPVYNEQQERM